MTLRIVQKVNITVKEIAMETRKNEISQKGFKLAEGGFHEASFCIDTRGDVWGNISSELNILNTDLCLNVSYLHLSKSDVKKKQQ